MTALMRGEDATTNASHVLLLPAASARRSIWFSSVTPAFPFCARPHSSLSGFVAKSGPATVVPHTGRRNFDERVADPATEDHQTSRSWQGRGRRPELPGGRSGRGDTA